MENETDSILIGNIINEIASMDRMNGHRIRQAAKDISWRQIWSSSKKVGDLFGKPIIDLDSYQQTIVYWSQVYDSVYESMDRPDDDVIDDDEELDKWFENQARKRKVKAVEEGKVKSNLRLSKRMSGHGEVFIVANPNINPHAPTTQEIEDLNDSMARTFKKKEIEKIKKHKILNEKDLRQRGNHAARKIIGSRDAVLKKSGLGGTARSGKADIRPGGSIN